MYWPTPSFLSCRVPLNYFSQSSSAFRGLTEENDDIVLHFIEHDTNNMYYIGHREYNICI